MTAAQDYAIRLKREAEADDLRYQLKQADRVKRDLQQQLTDCQRRLADAERRATAMPR